MESIFSEINEQLPGVNEKLVNDLKVKVTDYILTFRSPDEVYNKHIELKKIHIFRVLREITELATGLNLPDKGLYAAQILALLHDIGRFEQYDTYSTFSDAASANHSEIAIRVIEKQDMLNSLSYEEKNIVFQCILNHNIPRILSEIPPLTDFLTRLLRDADKLDIWRLALENDVWHTIEKYKRDPGYKVPPKIMDCFNERRIVPVELAPTLADSYLLRISWIFDINFKPSFHKINNRNIIQRFLIKFVDSEDIQKIDSITENYIQENLNRSYAMAEKIIPGSSGA